MVAVYGYGNDVAWVSASFCFGEGGGSKNTKGHPLLEIVRIDIRTKGNSCRNYQNSRTENWQARALTDQSRSNPGFKQQVTGPGAGMVRSESFIYGIATPYSVAGPRD